MTRIAAIDICSGLPCITRSVTFAVIVLLTWPKSPVTQDKCPVKKTLVIKMIHAPVIIDIKIGSQRGVQRRKITRVVTLANTTKGVRGWLKTTNAKIITRLMSRAVRCHGWAGVQYESGAVSHIESFCTGGKKRPKRCHSRPGTRC